MFLRRFAGTGTSGDGTGAIVDKDVAGEVLDELSLMEAKLYQFKVGKYLRTALQCVQYPIFWWIIFVANQCRAPLLHFYASLCKQSSRENNEFPIVNLIRSVIPHVENDFHFLLETFWNWIDNAWAYSRTFPDRVDGSDLLVMFNAAISMILHNAAAYHRRVASVYRRRHMDMDGDGNLIIYNVGCRVIVMCFLFVSINSINHKYLVHRLFRVLLLVYSCYIHTCHVSVCCGNSYSSTSTHLHSQNIASGSLWCFNTVA